MIIDDKLAGTVLSWFRSLDHGAGSNVRLQDVRFFTLLCQLGRQFDGSDAADVPNSEPMQRMQEALETTLTLGEKFLSNGVMALQQAEKGDIPDSTLDSYHDAQRDLWSVVESVRRLLLKGRFVPRPERRNNPRGYWHANAISLAHHAAVVLSSRRNQPAGVQKPTSPAIVVTQQALAWIYDREAFKAEAIVKAIQRRKADDKFYTEDVRRRTSHLRSIVLPNTGECPGIGDQDIIRHERSD